MLLFLADDKSLVMFFLDEFIATHVQEQLITMSQIKCFCYHDYLVLLFLGAYIDKFKHLSLCQLDLDMHLGPIIDWIKYLAISEELGSYNSFTHEFLCVTHLVIHENCYDFMPYKYRKSERDHQIQ